MSSTTEASAATDCSMRFATGPWHMHHVPGDRWEIVTNDAERIATVEIYGDAVSIALLPDLVDALRELTELAKCDADSRHKEQSMQAVERAGELLQTLQLKP